MSSIAIIGAGLAGISAARVLADHGHRVVIFEKSRGWGGRCASKRWEGSVVDHGAQYFTLRDPDFRNAVENSCGERVKKILTPVRTESGEILEGGDRFYHVEGNSRLVRALGEGLDVRTSVEIREISEGRVEGEAFDRILSTAPLPQTLKLAGLPAENPYIPCLTALCLYDMPFEGSVAQTYAVSDRSGHPLAWTACENHKTGRVAEGRCAFVIQASEAFSRAHLEDPPDVWLDLLVPALESRWGLSAARRLAVHPHRWRYARVAAAVSAPVLPEGWDFAGDALDESRVESAWLAGKRIAESV